MHNETSARPTSPLPGGAGELFFSATINSCYSNSHQHSSKRITVEITEPTVRVNHLKANDLSQLERIRFEMSKAAQEQLTVSKPNKYALTASRASHCYPAFLRTSPCPSTSSVIAVWIEESLDQKSYSSPSQLHIVAISFGTYR